jgi:hypothetical protein
MRCQGAFKSCEAFISSLDSIPNSAYSSKFLYVSLTAGPLLLSDTSGGTRVTSKRFMAWIARIQCERQITHSLRDFFQHRSAAHFAPSPVVVGCQLFPERFVRAAALGRDLAVRIQIRNFFRKEPRLRNCFRLRTDLLI